MDFLKKKMQLQRQQQQQGQNTPPPPTATYLSMSGTSTPESAMTLEEIKDQIGHLVQARERDYQKIQSLAEGGAGLQPEISSVELNSVISLPVKAMSEINHVEISVEYVACRDLPPFLADQNWLSDSILCILQEAVASSKSESSESSIDLRMMTTRVAAAKMDDSKKQFRHVLGRSGSPLTRQMAAGQRMRSGSNGDGAASEDIALGGMFNSGLRNVAVPRNGGRPGSRSGSPQVRSSQATVVAGRSGSPLNIPRQYDETDVGEAFATMSVDSATSSNDGNSSPCSSGSFSFFGEDYEALYRNILPANFVVLEVDTGAKGPTVRDMWARFGSFSAECVTTGSDGAVVAAPSDAVADAKPALATLVHRVKALGGKYGVSERRAVAAGAASTGGATAEKEAVKAGCVLWIALPYNATGAPHSSIVSRWNRGSPRSSANSSPIHYHTNSNCPSPQLLSGGSSPTTTTVEQKTLDGKVTMLPLPLLRSVPSSDEMMVHNQPLTGTTPTFEVVTEQEDPVLAAIGKLHVLAVDDAPSVLKRVQLLLCKRGATVVCVPGGDEAVDAFSAALASVGDAPPPVGERTVVLPPSVPPPAEAGSGGDHSRRRKFDLIFMDRMMPGIDGCEATRRIRAIERDSVLNPAKHHCIIFGMSANTEDLKAKEEFFSSGIDAFIPKPFGFADFRSAFEEVTSKAAAAAAAAVM